VTSVIVAIVAVLIGLAAGAALGFFVRRFLSRKRYEAAQVDASRVLKEAGEQKRSIIIEAKEEALGIRSASEAELRERRSELKRLERRLSKREEKLDRRGGNLDRRERQAVEHESANRLREAELEDFKSKEIERLENLSNLSVEEAEARLLQRAEEDIQHEILIRYRDHEEHAKKEAEEKARNLVVQAVQRLASEVVSEITVTTVRLPSDDMKGRLIGREGRNIRAIERATGVDLIIDDTPEAVTLSCFDPVRREIARVALTRLISDGRIHPARIEETVNRSEKEVWDTIWKSGEEAVFQTGVRGLHPEVVKLLGRLKYRFSYGENVLLHSIEVGNLAGMLAAEIGANVKVAKMGGLLHDIGKALSHEVEGPHAEIGAAQAAKYNVSRAVCACIGEHHDDHPSSAEGFIVAAADAISAARPGARRDTVEHYIKRLEALEGVAGSFDGVEKCYAIQAGREVRVMVRPEKVDDLMASKMARDIAKRVEETLAYPGQIKVTVIRESRKVEYAR
jgi:ribonuclease Y